MKNTKLFAALCCTAVLFAACEQDKTSDPVKDTTVNKVTIDGVTVSGSIASHDYVDLGLSVKWATCNLDATKPEEFGNYYAWGETALDSVYSWDAYKYGTDFDALTKYCNNSSYGTVDNLTTLEAADDAATANWGSEWRMPTIDEWKELISDCTWKWVSLNEIDGYEVKSSKNGNTLFLPAASCRRAEDLGFPSAHGCYWSSSLGTDNPSGAQSVFFYSGDHYTGNSSRCYLQTIRPVSK